VPFIRLDQSLTFNSVVVQPKPTFALSADGHAKDIKPPAPFDTGARMFAGATITFNTSNPLKCGDKAVVEMYHPAEGVKIKEGNKRGPLVFVEEGVDLTVLFVWRRW
jgi:hypothetical protein